MKSLKAAYARAKPYIDKLMKDNVGVLATIIAWNVLTSMVPIVIGLVAISGFILQGAPSLKTSVVAHLSQALQGVLKPGDLTAMADATTKHSGLFAVIALAGVFWGGSNVGGAISTAFQPIFEVSGRNFIKEKLIDMGMIMVIAILLIVIVAATSFGALVNTLFSNFPLSGASSFVVGAVISLVAGFALFYSIYFAFPNVKPRLKFDNIWRGALLASVLFEVLSFIWPLYAHFAHFSRYGALLGAILVLTAWIYFFALITVVGAEIAAMTALVEANDKHVSIGPEPQDTVPQHRVLRRA